MASGWIAVHKTTPRKPEVLAVAIELGIHPDQAFGLCFRFWAWCDDHMTSDSAALSPGAVDAIIDVPGFALALEQAGWLVFDGGQMMVPNFDRFMSETAKERCLGSARAARARGKSEDSSRSSVTDVTEMSRSERDRSVTDALATKPNQTKPKTIGVNTNGVGAEGVSTKRDGRTTATVVLPKLTRNTLEDNGSLLAFFDDAVQAGVLERSEVNRLRVFGAAERALEHGKRSPAGLFAKLVRDQAWDFISAAQEDRAAARLKSCRAAPSTEVQALLKTAVKGISRD